MIERKRKRELERKREQLRLVKVFLRNLQTVVAESANPYMMFDENHQPVHIEQYNLTQLCNLVFGLAESFLRRQEMKTEEFNSLVGDIGESPRLDPDLAQGYSLFYVIGQEIERQRKRIIPFRLKN
ncbi:MAG: hypothetical protein ABI425_02080 [Patescibacteria group bacterium]